MSWGDSLTGNYLGQAIRGILKIALAAVVAVLLSNLTFDLTNVTLGGTTVNLQIIWDVTRTLAPLLLVISGLRDLGVRF